MPTVAQNPKTINEDLPQHTVVTTTLFDLIATLNDGIDDTDAALVPATITDLCRTSHMRFLSISEAHRVICT
jgi:hypothetical protein